MKRVLALLLVLAGPAQAQYFSDTDPAYPPVPAYWQLDWALPLASSSGNPALFLPLTENGGQFIDDGGAHNFVTYSDATLANLPTKGGTYSDAPGMIPGFVNGVRLDYNATTGTYLYKNVDAAAGEYRITSVYVRMEDGGVPVPSGLQTAGDFCLIVDGSIVTNTPSLLTTAVGGGVYRVSGARIVSTGGVRGIGIVKYNTQSTRALYVSGYQYERALDSVDYTPSTYVPTTTTADTAYTVSHLTWDGRHNLITFSEQIDNAAWSKGGAGTGSVAVVTPGAADGPDGSSLTAERVVFALNGGTTISDRSYVASANYTSALGVPYYASVWARTESGTCSAALEPASGGSGASGRFTATTTWTRYTSPVWVGTGGAVNLILGLRSTWADDACTLLVFGAQINATSVTTYVPTTTAAKLSVPQESISGVTWTGDTVPAVASTSSPFSPGKAGAGPYSAANVYTGPTSVADFTGDFSVTTVFVPTSFPSIQVLVNKRDAGATAGWQARIDATGSAQIVAQDGAVKAVGTVNTATVGAINVHTIGKSGGTCYTRLNGGASNSIACGAIVSAPTTALIIGNYPAGVQPATTTTIYEVIASTEPYSDALHLARWQAATGLDRGPVSVTRAESQSYTQNGTLWQAAPATLAVTSTGSEVWKASAPGITAQSASCVGGAVSAPWALTATGTCTADAAVAPDGTTTMDEWTSAAISDRVFQTATVASGTTFTASTWASKPSGTGYATVGLRCTGGTPSTCACGTSDGSACTPTTAGADCFAYASAVGTTPIRVWSSATCSVAITNPSIYLSPGNHSTATGTARFWGAQVEPGLYPTPYMTASRSATVATVPLPTLGNRWCVSVTATPGDTWANAVVGSGIWYAGTAGAANSFGLYRSSATNLGLTVYDSAAGTKSLSYPLASLAKPSRLTACNNSGTLSLCANGVGIGALSGAGTGLGDSTPTTLNIGNRAGLQFDGTLSNLKVCRGATKCSDCR